MNDTQTIGTEIRTVYQFGLIYKVQLEIKNMLIKYKYTPAETMWTQQSKQC